MENPENPKCNNCKKKWKPEDTDIKKYGKVYKTCKNCREIAKEYRKNNKEKVKEKAKEYRENNKEKIAEINKEWRENNKEKITEYRENNKEKLTEKKKEYYENNKEKLTEIIKQYRENNKEKLSKKYKEYYENNKERKKQYRENNKEKIKEKAKEYRENNKKKIKEKAKEYYKNNKKKIIENHKDYYEKTKCDHNKLKGKCKICNLSLYLVNKQRLNIWRCLKVSSQNKTKSSIDYLGCDADYFIEYFKKKMDIYNEKAEIKMNWDNIHIDHIKPITSFNLDDEDELNKCCNYTNFQPLLIEDNLTKNNKWTDEDEAYWNENIINKEHFGIYLSV